MVGCFVAAGTGADSVFLTVVAVIGSAAAVAFAAAAAAVAVCCR